MPKLVFALHESGRVTHVSDVLSGLACKCACLDCREPLVARKGEIREHHFGHTSGREHDWVWETHLHAYANQLIVDAGSLVVPLHVRVAPALGFAPDQPFGLLRAGQILPEKEAPRGAVRPDVLLHLATCDTRWRWRCE
jgi:competence protein CoiA